MNQLQLDEIAQSIESSFGEELPQVGGEAADDVKREFLSEVMADSVFQCYLQDQVNRQIIRDYLINAVVLGTVSESSFEYLSTCAATSEGRSSLSLHMLMNSVEAANDMCNSVSSEGLKALRPGPHSPPHMEIVRN